MSFLLTSIFFLSTIVIEALGHGILREPPSRSTLWRYDSTATPNYSDNQLYCSGYSFQWDQMGGRCGLCGDPYNDPRPRDNENTGKYGQGKVVREYSAGSVVDVEVYLSGNHLGNFVFSICVLEDPDSPESGEECFQQVPLANGEPQYNVTMGEVVINTQLRLPAGLRCNRCVLRWHYTTGNNWGACDDGASRVGCGPQENFRACADIAVV